MKLISRVLAFALSAMAGAAERDDAKRGMFHGVVRVSENGDLGARRFTDGARPAARYRFTARFHTDAKKPDPAFECPHDPSMPRFAEQSGCIDAVEIHGSRIQARVTF